MSKEKKPVRMIVIDATKREVREERFTGDTLEAMQGIVGGYIERVVTLENRDDIFCNEQGLFKDTPYWFHIKGTSQPITGNGVVAGCTPGGTTRDARSSLEQIRELVTFMDELTVAIVFSKRLA